MDPNLQRSYSGETAGVGAVYAWKGNKKVGEGRMEITESKPAAFVRLKLDFIAPMKANNMTDFNVMAQGSGTRIIWLHLSTTFSWPDSVPARRSMRNCLPSSATS